MEEENNDNSQQSEQQPRRSSAIKAVETFPPGMHLTALIIYYINGAKCCNTENCNCRLSGSERARGG